MGQEEEAAKRSRAAPNNYVYYQPSWTPQHRRQPAPCGGSKPVAQPACRLSTGWCSAVGIICERCMLVRSRGLSRHAAGLELSFEDDNQKSQSLPVATRRVSSLKTACGIVLPVSSPACCSSLRLRHPSNQDQELSHSRI